MKGAVYIFLGVSNIAIALTINHSFWQFFEIILGSAFIALAWLLVER